MVLPMTFSRFICAWRDGVTFRQGPRSHVCQRGWIFPGGCRGANQTAHFGQGRGGKGKQESAARMASIVSAAASGHAPDLSRVRWAFQTAAQLFGREGICKCASRVPSSPSLPHLAVRQNPTTLSLSPSFPGSDVCDVRWGLAPGIVPSPVASHSTTQNPAKGSKSRKSRCGCLGKKARPRNWDLLSVPIHKFPQNFNLNGPLHSAHLAAS